MKKKRSSATAKMGLNFVRGVVESENSLFHEIHQENDYGNDAFIELVDGENVRGITVAAQIKSGKSYCSKDKCSIRASKDHFKYWSENSHQVVGFVFDPNENVAYWIDISGYLKGDRELVEKGPFTISFEKSEVNRFDIGGFKDFFLPIFLKKPIAINLKRSREFAISEDPDKHGIGIHSLMENYRDREDVWDLFFQLFENREPNSISLHLIYFIAHIPGHGDIFWSKRNILRESHRKKLREKLKVKGKDFVLKLLGFIDENGFERATIGQNVDAIISVLSKKEKILTEIVNDKDIDDELRVNAMILLACYLQEDSIPILQQKSIMKGDMGFWAKELLEHFKSNGFISFY